MKKTIRVTINGRLYEEDIEPHILLSHFLRELRCHRHHVDCIIGECGARLRSVVMRRICKDDARDPCHDGGFSVP